MNNPTFRELFAALPDIRARAPGRVNLMGEHTDYNGGFVLPTVIPQETTIELARARLDRVRVWSANGGPVTIGYALGAERPRGHWVDYVQGVTDVLRRTGFAIGGFDARIESSVPVGAGVSSSAALEVALMRALRVAFDLAIDDLRLALLAQRVETEFVGAPVGVMDQMAASIGRHGSALFIDTRALSHDNIPLPTNLELAVIDSGVPHSHATGDYRKRRAECQAAAAQLGVEQLRDLSDGDLAHYKGRVDDLLWRRARHVVSENERVLATVTALRAGDRLALGTLLSASHASMRDDFQVSTPAIDALVETAEREPDVYGARLTGGGFGGSIIAVVRSGRAATAAHRITEHYAQRHGGHAVVLVPPPGAKITAAH